MHLFLSPRRTEIRIPIEDEIAHALTPSAFLLRRGTPPSILPVPRYESRAVSFGIEIATIRPTASAYASASPPTWRDDDRDPGERV